MQPSVINHPLYANNLISDVPLQLCSGIGAVPKATSHRIVMASSTTASQTSGGVSIINIVGQGYMKTGSAYLKLSGSVTTTNVAQASNLGFANMLGSLSSIINRITVSSNGTQLETMNNYGLFVEPQLIMQASNMSYVLNDYSMMQKSAQTQNGYLNISQAVTNIPFSGTIPLIAGVLNSTQSWNLSLAPIQVQIDYNSVSQAFTQTTGGVPTEYTITRCDIVYENIMVEANMQEAIRAEMQTVPFTIPFSSLMSFSKNAESTCLYNIGVNYTSCNAVFMTHAVPKTLANYMYFKSNNQTDFSIYNDNQLVNTTNGLSVVNNISSVFSEMQRGFSVLQDTTVTAAYATGGIGAVSARYEDSYFLSGISLNRFNENFNLAGTTVKQLTIGNNCTIVAGDTSYIIVTYSGYITIDVLGVVSRYI